MSITRKAVLLTSCFIVLIASGLGAIPVYADEWIHFIVNGADDLADTKQHRQSLDIAGDYRFKDADGDEGTITIHKTHKKSSANARIDFIVGGQEKLVMRNVKITTDTPFRELKITFWREIDDNRGGRHTYQIRGGGLIKRDTYQAAEGAVLVWRAAVEHPLGTPNVIADLVKPPARIYCRPWNLKKCVGPWYVHSIFHWNRYVRDDNRIVLDKDKPRKLIVEVWLTLTDKDDYLQLNDTGTTGIQLQGVPYTVAGVKRSPFDEPCDRCSEEDGSSPECEFCHYLE